MVDNFTDSHEPLSFADEYSAKREVETPDSSVGSSSSSTSGDLAIIPRNVCPSVCAICGEAAVGYHYEVPSCNGCKAFFRRAVLSQKQYKCKADGTCFDFVPNKTRVLCRSCRFRKCVDVGMNPLAIQLSEEQLEKSKVKLIVRKRQGLGADQPSTSKVLTTIEQQITNVVDQLMYLEVKWDKLRKSRFNPDPHSEVPPLRELIKTSAKFELADRLGPMPGWPIKCQKPPPSLQQIREHFKQGIIPRRHNPHRKHWLCFDLLLIIEYAKTFPFFHKLADDDKVALLRGVALLCFDLSQAFFSYENKSDKIIHPDGTSPPPAFPHEVLELKLEKDVLVGPLIRYNLTKSEYVLFKAILLCNPSVANLSDEAVAILEEERMRLSASLLSVCMANFGSAKGADRYASIISISDLYERMARKIKDFHTLFTLAIPHSFRIALLEDIMNDS